MLFRSESFVIDNNLGDRVFFLGPRSDIFSLMNMVDVNILASNYEGLSLAALEAMSTGKPFIASNVDGLDFVVNNQSYLFENEPESLGDLILKLYNDKDLKDNLVLEAKKKVDLEFDSEIQFEKLKEIFKGV